MTKGSDLLIATLENEGVEYVFGLPGEENLDVIESLRRSRIRLVLTRHEQAAAFMAATHGRLTGRPGVCLATLGPGALNMTTGAAYAHLGAMPMIMITGQKPILSSRQGRFQIVDVVATMRPLTKMSRQIVSAASIPVLVRDAFRIAVEERRGPVHLELPEDIAAEEANAPLIAPHPIDLPVAPASALDRAADMIIAAERPLIMLGAAASRPHLAEPLSAFVRRMGIPFFNTQMGKGAVSGGSNLYLGTAALSERDYVHLAIDRADLILSVGHDTVEKPPFIMGPNGPRVIHVGHTSATVEQVFFPHAEVVGDMGASLLDAGRASCRQVEPRLGSARVAPGDLAAGRGPGDRGSLSVDAPTYRARRARRHARARHRDLDNGMYKIWFARNYRTRVANTLLLDNALAAMGAGLPSAIMATLLHPERRVLAICGDGGFMMNSQETETAVRLGVNLVVLILEDRAYGMIRWKQAVEGFADWGMTFGNPDFIDTPRRTAPRATASRRRTS